MSGRNVDQEVRTIYNYAEANARSHHVRDVAAAVNVNFRCRTTIVNTARTKHAGPATDWGSASTHLVPSVYTLQNHV